MDYNSIRRRSIVITAKYFQGDDSNHRLQRNEDASHILIISANFFQNPFKMLTSQFLSMLDISLGNSFCIGMKFDGFFYAFFAQEVEHGIGGPIGVIGSVR